MASSMFSLFPCHSQLAVTYSIREASVDAGWMQDASLHRRVGFNKWAVKPCGKAAITAIVQDARKTLLGIKDEIETDPDLRRYTM
jgi:hypothetical protein